MSTCKLCGSVRCDNPPDLALYSLENDVLFNPQYSFVVECPPGYYCAPNTFPQIIIIPAGTFQTTIPAPGSNQPLTLQCCESLLNFSTAGLDANGILSLAAQMLQTCAQQQAACNALTHTNPLPVPVTFLNQKVFAQHVCPENEVTQFTGVLPAWINLNTGTGELFVYAGIFSGDTQAEADATAQTLLNEWLAARVADGTMTCTPVYQNTLQSYGCPSGETDQNHTNIPINGDGLYISDGTAFAAAGYFNSFVSQADADAQALQAATDFFNLYVSDGTINCQASGPCGTTPQSVESAGWTTSTAGSQGPASVDPVVNGDIASWSLEVTATENGSQWEASCLICNPNATAYDITITAPADSAGSITFLGAHIAALTVFVDGNVVAQDEVDVTTMPHTFVGTFSLTPGIHSLNVFLQFSSVGNPTATVFSTAAVTIRPLTPP